ncbi:microtubule-actin cross-linking factor 1, isoforms 1/2/3/5-like isoform X9 [Gigantopelta aegis]|uniref:microtubule-actin cross-linking factor 1, isoforms 1/2/3/5-like isoform X9 n=1 Tax=Gigantopelta aegis TaxID=1735272 RepID=UPI001B88D871|nr:microtubule-actin cross-linking factor 1, isoforms 1/2/3/5-like isoform X9 [Gigantopelta aegis]
MDKGAWETHKQYPQEDYDALPLCILQLDPADRAVIRIADERDAVQKKTFTKWVNKHLLKAGRRIVELYDDMRDGHNLISLLEVLSHEVLPRERGHMRFHKIQNVQICLDFLKMKGIRLVNIRSDEIVDGNPKLTLGLIWTIILHFQVSDVVVPGQPEHITARDALLLWSRRTVEGFPGVHIKDFSSSWRDGKAFLAIAHRHRPDLVDVRQAKQSSNKQNLETAFRLYEREFGVTRLLDPEDIDVQQPDERSVITYVSSLYDVFPEVPTVEQSLRDNERQLKTEEYQDLASSLLSWLMSTIGMLEQRDFPSTLIEIKKRLSDFNRFRLEEIPPRLETKQKLLRLFEEIQGLTADSSQTGINEELLPDNIIRLWNKFVAVQQEKDMAFQAEILRLERLQRLAEKIHREAKYNEDTLRDQEKRIGEEEARVDVVHPFEAKRSCDNIDRSLRTVEENLRGLFRDLHSLQDGKYPQADNLYKRISDIQSELSQLRTRLYSNVIQRLLSKSYVEEGKTTIRRTEVVTEVRMVETHPAFKHVQDCLDWIEEKQKQIEAAEYDSDLTQVELLIQTHHREHQEVVAFRREIDRCINDRRTLSEEEQKLYTQTLSKVEVAYSLLSNTSMRRQKCLESLYEFLQASTAELLWLSEKEELEIRRDWGSHQLSLADVEDQHKTLVRQLEDQESQFNAVQEKGGAMILDRHPASKVVEAYMATMQSQWSWLLQLTACLESHLRHSTSYFQFFEECHHCDQWIARQTDQLQNRYARDVVSSDEGQHMMRDLQAVQEQIKEYDRRVSSLVLRSTEILPIHQRSQPVQDSVRVRALCNCQQTEVSFQKGEECMLLDNSQHARWKVRTAVGLEAVIPSVCFIIPPPDPEAIEKANRLKLQIEHLQNSWKTQYRRLRLNMVLATIRLVKGWTLKQFMAMDPSQREAIWRALQDDAEKLLSRGVEGDADLIRLERELKECHQIFLQLSAEAAAEEARQMRTPSQDFLQQLDTINRNLSMCDQQLSTLLHKPVPNSRDSLTQATDNYDVFDNSLNACENSVLELQSSYLSVTPQTSQVESRLNLVVQKFDQLKAISHIYVQRLKNADLVVSGLEEVKQIVSDYEITLASHENMTSELKGLRNHKEELQDLQSSIQQQQPKIDTLKRDTATLRTLVENSRPGLTHHHDLDTIEKDVEDVGARWDNVCIQVVERLRSVDTAVDHASLYQNGLVGEQDWIDQMQARIETQAPLNGDVDQAKKLLEPSMSIYNSLGERRHQIESVNRHGGQYIREAKGRLVDSYDKLFQELKTEISKVGDLERILKEDHQIGDEAYQVQSQLETQKAVHEDILSHQQRILSLVFQAEQLTENYQEELTPEQVTEIQSLATSLKSSLDKVVKTSENRLKHLTTAAEEVVKFEDELGKMTSWLTLAENELDRQEECLRRFEDFKPLAEKQKTLVADVMSHQAELRFMSLTSQKFLEEAKLHKLEVDSFKSDRQRPARLSLISMEGLAAEGVRDGLKDATTRYHDLKNNCNTFGDKLADLAAKQREYNDVAFKMLSWLTNSEDRLMSIKQDSGSPDPEILEQQLNKLKALGSEAIGQGTVIDDLQHKGQDLTKTLRGISADPIQVQKMEDTMTEITDRHLSLQTDISEQTNALQASITKSQGVHEAVDGLLSWLDKTDQTLRNLQPVSLNRDGLNRQYQDFQTVSSDVDHHKASIGSVQQTAHDLIKTCDLEMARSLELRLDDVDKRYREVQEKCRTRNKDLEEVSDKLRNFQNLKDEHNSWMQTAIDKLDSKELGKLPSDEMKNEIDAIMKEKQQRQGAIADLKRIGNELVKDPRTGDVSSLKDGLIGVERNWNQLVQLLDEKEREADLKEKQGNEFENAKNIMLLWLAAIEDRINCFDPVAIEIDIVEKQISELEPMLEEYEEQGAKVDEVNDLGNGLEALQSSDRPLSPIRRFGRLGSRRLLSPRLRTPSPTFPASPSSESSGISSRKSSSDNFLLDDLSETQQQLLDINQRYDIVGERLADRQQELQNVLSSIKTFLQDLQDMLSWLDIKDQETNANQSVPTSEKEAKRKLKDHEKFHHELVGKEGLVEDIRKKAQHLLRTRQGVKGLDSLQQQLTDLDDKWHGLRASSEQKRKMLEDVVTDLQNLRENGEQLTKWLSQKEKMMDVLGPVAVEPSLVQNQRDQVKVLQEEMASQEPLYDQFFQAGHSILDKCEPDSRDSASVSRKLESVGKSWDRLQARLKDRESNLKAMESMGSDFSDVTQKLGDKLNKLSTSLESLAPVNPCPGGQKLQAKEMMTLEEELSEIMPLMARAKELSKQLCDKTKDSATKAETRSKLARLEKSFGDAKKKLDNRKSTLDSAGKAGEKFACDCEETLGWVKDAIRQIREGEPVSGDAGALRQQAQQHKGIQQDIASREPDIRELLDNGSKILEDTVPSHETQQLLDMLETIQSDWDYLRDVARTKDDKLARTMAHAEKYHENLDKMLLWLQLSEDKLKKAQPQEWNKDAVGKTLKELQALQKDVLKKTHDHDNLNREGEALIGCVEDGQPEIEQQLKSINERWEDLNSEMGERTVGLEDLQQRLVEISDNINDANGCLRKWDDKLQTHLSMGAISKDPKYFDKIKSIQEDVSGLQSQLDYLEALTDGIDVDVVDAPGPSGLHDDVSAIKNKQQDLQGKLGELLSEMETGSQVVDEFQNLVKSVGNDLSDMEDELNRKEPVARDDYMLDSQKDEIQDFLTRLGDKSDDLVQVENKGRELVRAGYVTDPKKLQSQIDGLAKQHERLAGRANQRKADIQGSKKKVEKLNSDLKKTRDRIETAAKEIDSFKPVGGQVKAIQQEQAVLKDFIKRKVDPLQKQFETVSAEGQSFVQSAPSGVDTSEMESDLEVLGDKWSELTQKVSEREQNLASAFIHSGKFNEALDSLLSWLAETEDLVANQKPPSPEHKVVKAQLQEQKFLQKMLVDRAPSVQSVQESAAKLESNLDPAEKRKAQNQMKELASRWDALNKKGSDRMNTLEEVLVLAKDFQDIHDPMLTWLDEKEKKFASLEPKTLDTEGIKKLVKDLKALEKTIDDQDDTVRDIAVKGKGLQDYCKGEDVVHVQMKIDNVQKRYCDLKNKVEDTLEQMEEALPLAQRFQDAHEKLVDWIAKVEPEVRSKDVTCPEAEEHVQSLLDKVEEIQPLLEVLTLEGSELADLAPGDTGLRVEDLISKDNKKFEDLKDQVNKLAEKVQLSRQKSSEVIAELDDLVEWFDEEEGKLLDSDPISSNSSKLQGQLAQQKAINDDINSQKAKARDAIAMGKKLMRENSLENETPIREKMDALKQKADAVSRMSNDRLGKLEQALPLAKHFADTHEDLVSWLEEMEPALAELEVMTINADQVKKQQERIKALKQDVVDHKPTVDRLNKTGAALLQLCGEHDAEKVQKTLDDDNSRIEKVRSGVRDRSNSIDEALQQSADFSDKLEDMVENLTATSEQVANAEPISAHPDKLREQIAENKNIVEDMQMREAALESVRSTAEELLKQAGDYDDEAVKDVKQKLDELLKLYADIQNNTDARGRNLEDTLEVSEKFWDDLNSLMGTLTDLQENVAGHEPPAIEPEAIREQQEELEALKEDLQATQADLEDTHNTGDQLISLVGETDKPEVQKNIDDLDSNMANLTEEYEKRAKSLKEALTKSLKFQDQLMKLLVWLQKKEERLCDLEPIGTDFETIKDQWHELKTFKAEVEPKQVEIEALNHQANELAKETTADQAAVVKEPMAEVNTRWDQFMGGINERQRLLQLALLNIGQLDHAIKEQMSWLGKTDKTLDDIVPVYGDPRMVEIELAKLKVIENDIKAHQPSFDSINDEAHKVMASGGVAEAQGLRQKLNDLNNNFDEVCEKAAGKKAELEGALQEAQDFSNELQDVLMALGEVDGQLITSKLVGGLPETAKEQLEKFMEVYADLETLHPRIQETVNKGENLAYKTTDPAAENLRGNLNALQQRWNHVKGRADDRKKKLEDAENLAANFHVELNKFIGWLTDTEKTLNNLEPVSRLVDKVTAQIDDHRALQKNVSKHREAMIALDKMGTHLKYFSQKQDVILIKNLLSSVQHRWEKIVSRSAERTRHLERGFKEAKQFNDMWGDLIDWLKEAEIAVNADQFIANEPDKIKAQIAKHKEFQKKLGSKQPKFDTVNRTGRVLKERCPPEDGPVIQQMLNDLKTRWNNICGKSVDRQRKLEEALLFSGQFNEAFQALLDWLAKVEPLLSEDQPVHGDLDTVNSLIDGHKTFQQELGARTNTVQFVRKSAKELIEKSTEDTSQLQAQLIELSTMWDRTCRLSVSKQERLEQAHKLAEEFHKKAHGLLDWLGDAERQLRYRGPVPDEELLILQQIEDHKKFEESLLRQEANLRETLNIGQEIMKLCHPDAVSTMKHWLSVLRARWEELTGMCKHRGRRLAEGLKNVRNNNTLLDELLAWLNGAEVKLTTLDSEPIPQDAQIITKLINDHQDFQNEMSSKQPEVDRLTKPEKRRPSSTSSDIVSHIPVLRGTPKIPIRHKLDVGGRQTPDHGLRRIPDMTGRRTPDMSGRRTPDMSGRRTPDMSGRHTPDYSGRRTPDHSSGHRTPEPQFRNPRVGALFNKWRQVWLMAMDRQRKLQDALDYLNEVERMKNFDFDDWRRRYLRWMHHNKARIMDFFRRQDRDRDGRVTRKEFIDGILISKFPTSKLEMEAVANIFDKDGDGFINYKEFVAALRPDREPAEPATDADKIQDEVKRQCNKCTCMRQFKIHKIGEGKYRFGDSQKLRLVRILRSTVMVRVGGGWIALDEFLVKNDPCRVGLWRQHRFRLRRRFLQLEEQSKGRTNIELREQFILAEGVSQSMTGFVSKSPAGSSHSGSSTHSANNSWSSRSQGSSSGPITKVCCCNHISHHRQIREKTQHSSPWRQRVKTSPDGEVQQILTADPKGYRMSNVRSPGNLYSPASRSSSRASTGGGSRPASRTGSDAGSEASESDVFSTHTADSRGSGSRSNTPAKGGSRIPRITPKKK